jgi:hypothetical protein
MYYRGKMFGFVHLYNGQEAVSTGVIGAMKRLAEALQKQVHINSQLRSLVGRLPERLVIWHQRVRQQQYHAKASQERGDHPPQLFTELLTRASYTGTLMDCKTVNSLQKKAR